MQPAVCEAPQFLELKVYEKENRSKYEHAIGMKTMKRMKCRKKECCCMVRHTGTTRLYIGRSIL